MKKLLPALLVLSLVANAALVVTHFTGGSASSLSASARPNTASKTATSASARSAQKIAGDAEFASLQDKLLKAGCPPEVAREVIRNMLWRPFHERQRAMIDGKNADKPYWQQTGSNKKQLTPEERAELRTLSDQIEARAASLLGGEYSNRGASRYGFLPADKAAALYQLQRDYSDMHDGVNDETSLFRLPSDNATRKLLREEQRRDLEAILSPAELAEYDLHYSGAASDLRKRFAALPDSTEEEYRAAYAIAKNMNGAKPDSALAAQQLRDLLGNDRYNAFVRANDADYTALQGAAARFDIPAATIESVYGLRDQAVSLSQQIAADKSLSSKDKQAALKTLANQMRNDVRGNLGKEIGNAYLDKHMSWLESLADGNILSSSPTGKISTKPVVKDNKTDAGAGAKQQKNADKTEKNKGPKKGK